MADSLLIGLTALNAQQQAITVASHNIANAATPGYSRQNAVLITPAASTISPGAMGLGVTVDAIRRISDNLINERLRSIQSEGGRLESLSQNLQSVQAIFNETGENGFSTAINNLFAGFQDIASNPESSALRSTVVQQVASFASSLSALGQGLERIQSQMQSGLTTEVREINTLTTQIATLNGQIRSQVNAGVSPNDLFDQRDALLNTLSQKIAVNVRTDAKDQTVTVDIAGHLLIGSTTSDVLYATGGTNTDDPLRILGGGNTAVPITGGAVAAYDQLQREVMPGLLADIDSLAATLAKRFNALQSTGTSNSFNVGSWQSETVIASDQTGADLDSTASTQAAFGLPGIPTAFLPSFTDANGTAIARNLTLNVLNTLTGDATKYTVRYDPGSAAVPTSRSLDDLVQAINTGHGGGFTVYPPSAGGVGDITARKVSVDGGFRLQLTAALNRSIDFSPALDLKASTSAWTGPAMTVSGSNVALADQRLLVRVNGTNLQLYTRSAVDGSESAYTTQVINAGGTSFTVGGVTVAYPAGTFRSGDSFAVEFNATGQVLQKGTAIAGNHVESPTWTASDATVGIKGRYTDTATFDPAQRWSMRVVTSGVIGAASSILPPNNPPVVEFTYVTGTVDAPVVQSVQRTLDSRFSAGTPVPIAAGVYAVFGAGNLTATAASQLQFTVDGSPDQARLLPALGINTLFSGSTAATLSVSSRLLSDPTQLAVGATRVAGDNTNAVSMGSVRTEKMFNNGVFSMDDQYQTAITGLGVRIQQATNMEQNQQVLQQTLQGQRDAISGVNLDEEIGQMVLMQQAYSASAKVVQFARENIQTLLGILS